ncbi:MAG: helix-turn-helix domain-containing protein [Erysipelothrix sp.]
MDLGEILKNARIEAGLTQEVVAQHLFITRQTVSRWEQNKTLPNIHILKELSELYGTSIDSLISENNINQEGNMKVRKINIMALIGSILFNVFLFSGIAFTLLILLVSLWVLVILFILSPVILAWAIFSGAQEFDWFNAILCIILMPVGILLVNYAKKLTNALINFFKRYYLYNMKTIFPTYS